MLTFGSIGCGNMGGAILSGVAKLEKWQVIGFDPCQAATDALHERCGLRSCDDEIEVAQQADVILIAVKPQHVQGVVEKIAPHLDGKLLVSLAAGVSLRRIKTYSGDTCPAVVIMPNTPAMVGEGCCALCLDDPTLNSLAPSARRWFCTNRTFPSFRRSSAAARPSSFTCWSRSWKLGCASASLTTMLNSSQKN